MIQDKVAEALARIGVQPPAAKPLDIAPPPEPEWDDEGDEQEVLWRPNPGPQTEFLISDAYEVLYGGAAGGGKTDALLACLLEQTEHPEFRGLFLRKTYQALQEVIDRTRALWSKLGARWNGSEMRWHFPSGATVELGYLETWADTERYQGRQFTVICYDELGQLAEERCWTFLMSRNRSTAPGLMRFMRASANPGGAGQAWVMRRFINACPHDGTPVAFRDDETGVVLTRAFFPARVEDNPVLVQNDPGYIARLNALPETQRKQLREGDWTAGTGMALDELSERVHIVKPFAIPPHWEQFGSFDWGFSHPFAFGWFAVSDTPHPLTGRPVVFLVDSVHGRRMKPHEIATRIAEQIPVRDLSYIDAGHDCFYEVKARGEDTPSIAEQFRQHGIYLRQANISRVLGLNNLRAYMAWRRMVATPDPAAPHDPTRVQFSDAVPHFFIFDTPGNRHTYSVLEGMVTDPKRREDALKVDADDDGVGGDDPYDMVRYGLASRPLQTTRLREPEKGIWHPDVLAEEAARKRTVKSSKSLNQFVYQIEDML